MIIYSFKTKIGWITICEDKKKLVNVKFCKSKNKKKSKNLDKIKDQIISFVERNRKKFTFKIHLIGTPIQRKIWNEIKNISYGKTKTYGEIAKKIKTSPRYVGNVCGQNKLLLIIPCHRVIRSDGSLGGFSSFGGIKLKKKLLDLERND